MKRLPSHIARFTFVFGIYILMMGTVFAQRKNLVILPGASFSGTGRISIQDSVINAGASAVAFHGHLVFVGTSQVIGSPSSNAIAADTMTFQGGTKRLFTTIVASDSLSIETSTTLIVPDTLRIHGASQISGTLQTQSSSVVEFVRSDGISQLIPGGTFHGKMRLLGSSSKRFVSAAALDSLEHDGGPLVIEAEVSLVGRAEFTNGGLFVSGSLLAGRGGIRFMNAVTIEGSGQIRSTAVTDSLRFQSSLTFQSTTATVHLAGTGIASFAITPSIISSDNFVFSPLSVCVYEGGSQSVLAASYGTLIARNAGVKLFPDGIVRIAGELLTDAGAGIDAVTNNSTVDFNGSASQDVAGGIYRNLQFSGDRAGQDFRLPADTIRVIGVFTNTITNAILSNAGNIFEYSGSDAQTIVPFSYYHLVVGGSGEKSVLTSLVTAGDVHVLPGTTLTIDSAASWQIGGTLRVEGDFVNNGTIDIAN